MRVLSLPELKSVKGIKFSRQHIHRLVAAGKFPAPIKLGQNTNGWVEREVDEYLSSRITARDSVPA
jgi:prophage regulatory protein